jgi:membrane protein implicated in regulation of membrane protease activity
MKKVIVLAILESIGLSVFLTGFIVITQKAFNLSNEKTAFVAICLLSGMVYWMNKRFEKVMKES